MTHVIAEPCIGTKDTACVEVCPVDCIHQAEDGSSEMLYIDPAECIDCAACVSACPVDAIFAEADLPAKWSKFTQMNADFFAGGGAAAAAAAGAPAAARAPAKAAAPEPEPEPEPLELAPEEMYRPITEIREELSSQRGLTDASETSIRRSPALMAVIAAAVLLFVYAVSNNFAKTLNTSLQGKIAARVLLDQKPTLAGNQYTMVQEIDGKSYVAKVQDSIFGGRNLSILAPTEPILGISHEEESFFAASTNEVSRYFHEFIDNNSDGKVDSVMLVREFWSKEHRFIGRYQKPIPPTEKHQVEFQKASAALAAKLGIKKS